MLQNMATFCRKHFIGAGTNSNPGKIKKTISIADYQIDLRGTAGNSYNKLQSLIKIKSDPNGNTIYNSALMFFM
ncbi:MAG: hypothetical protein R2779_06170 [Crocinitomicaceae bacterium]